MFSDMELRKRKKYVFCSVGIVLLLLVVYSFWAPNGLTGLSPNISDLYWGFFTALFYCHRWCCVFIWTKTQNNYWRMEGTQIAGEHKLHFFGQRTFNISENWKQMFCAKALQANLMQHMLLILRKMLQEIPMLISSTENNSQKDTNKKSNHLQILLSQANFYFCHKCQIWPWSSLILHRCCDNSWSK